MDNWILPDLSVFFPLQNFFAFRHSFGPDSEFLRNLFFFFNSQNYGDFTVLVETCRLLLQLVRDNGIYAFIKQVLYEFITTCLINAYFPPRQQSDV